MKKVFLLVCLFVCLGIVGCGGSGDGSTNHVETNIVNGKSLGFSVAGDPNNWSYDGKLNLNAGMTYTINAVVSDAQTYTSIPGYDCSKTVWTISGVGNFSPSGTTSAQGSDVTVVITASAGVKGNIRLELDGMILSFQIAVK